MNTVDLSLFQVTRRNGHAVPFDASKIKRAITNAVLRDANGRPRRQGDLALSASEREKVDRFTEQIVVAVTRRREADSTIGIEEIQDQVELTLMRAGEHAIARDYVLFREKRAQERQANQQLSSPSTSGVDWLSYTKACASNDPECESCQ